MAKLAPEILEFCPPLEFQSLLRERVGENSILPAAAARALEMVEHPDCSISDFSGIVERDVTLATDVLRLANSPAYGLARSVETLHQAVVVLGLHQCRNLILATCITSLMKKMELQEERIRNALWRHSFSTALLATHVNQSLNLGFQGEEFTAGLLHDIGRTLLALIMPERFSDVDCLDFVEPPGLLKHEDDIIGTNHSDLGAWFAAINGLPPTLVEVVRWHHSPELATDNRVLVSTVAAADHMANHLGRCSEGEGYAPDENEGIRVLAADVRASIEVEFSEMAVSTIDRVAEDSKTASEL